MSNHSSCLCQPLPDLISISGCSLCSTNRIVADRPTCCYVTSQVSCFFRYSTFRFRDSVAVIRCAAAVFGDGGFSSVLFIPSYCRTFSERIEEFGSPKYSWNACFCSRKHQYFLFSRQKIVVMPQKGTTCETCGCNV